jgi:hypothetical protein
VALISSGTASHPDVLTTDRLFGISESGEDLFFGSFEHLTGDPLDGSSQLYDARVGAVEALAPAPTPCAGEACRPGAGAPPVEPSAATPSFSGPGNATPRRCPPKKRKRKRCRRAAGKHRPAAKRRAARKRTAAAKRRASR